MLSFLNLNIKYRYLCDFLRDTHCMVDTSLFTLSLRQRDLLKRLMMMLLLVSGGICGGF